MTNDIEEGLAGLRLLMKCGNTDGRSDHCASSPDDHSRPMFLTIYRIIGTPALLKSTAEGHLIHNLSGA